MGFFDKLKQGLFKTKNAIVGKIDDLLKKFVKVDEARMHTRGWVLFLSTTKSAT